MAYRSEDTLIINALTPEVMDMAQIHKALTQFCKKKKQMVSTDRFNIIVFMKNGPHYIENFTLNPEHVSIALKSLEEDIVKANTAAGIFLAIKLIIEVFKSISERSFHLIIILDSGSGKIPTENIPTLENVIDKVKEMPLVIDIISINVEDSPEDLKLMNLSRRTNGDLYKIKKIRELSSIFNILVEKKEIPLYLAYNESVTNISEENLKFYENFADKPLEVNELRTCSICFQKDMNLIQCTKCGAFTHKNCWALWSKTSNIGIPNVFRCHNCFNLLKLDKKLVEMAHSGVLILEEPHLIGVQRYLDDIKIIDVQRYLENLETGEGPKIIHTEYPLKIIDAENTNITIINDDD